MIGINMKKILLNPKSKNLFTLVDDEDYDKLVQYHWNVRIDGYVYRQKYSKHKSSNFYMHREVMKAKTGQMIDHKNRNVLDNQKSNLRFCTYSQNLQNSSGNKSKQYPYKGIRESNGGYNPKRYEGVLKVVLNKKVKSFYTKAYRDIKEAARAYNELAKKHYGEFAYLNKI